MEFILAALVVFGIGMFIRWLIKRGKASRNSDTMVKSAPAAPPANSSPITPQAAFCAQCGNQVNSDSVFCPNCGSKVR
jgi:hypothetical protein